MARRPLLLQIHYIVTQATFTCGKPELNKAFTTAVSSVAAHHHLQLCFKEIRFTLSSIREINKTFLDISPNLLYISSSLELSTGVRDPQAATLNSEMAPSRSFTFSNSNGHSYPCAYCGGKRYYVDKRLRKRAENVKKKLFSLGRKAPFAEKSSKPPRSPLVATLFS